MNDGELRQRNESLVRRFVEAVPDGAERSQLWADDAVFEPALDPNGVVFRGKAAIMQRGRSAALMRDRRISDLVIYSMLDPNVFVVTHVIAAVERATGKPLRSRFASILTLRDGKVVHRIEFSAFHYLLKL